MGGGARSLSLLLDRLHRVEIESRPIAQLGVEDANRGMLQVNNLPMSTAMPNYSPYPLEMKVDPGSEVCRPGREPRDRARAN